MIEIEMRERSHGQRLVMEDMNAEGVREMERVRGMGG